MPTTGVAKYPYPNTTDLPDGPGALLLLGQRVAKMNGSGIGYAADASALAALITDGDAFTGLSVYHASADAVVRYNGSAFKLVGRKTFATAAAQTTWTSSYSGLLEAGSAGFRTDTGIEDRYSGSAWVPWDSPFMTVAPTLTNITLGTGTQASEMRYRYSGGMVFFELYVKLGTGGVLTGAPSVTLPVNHRALDHANEQLFVGGSYYDTSAGSVFPVQMRMSGSSVSIALLQNPTVAVNATSPFTWTVDDVISIKGSYRHA